MQISTGFVTLWKSLENSMFFNFFQKSQGTSGNIWILDDFEFSFLEKSGKCLSPKVRNFDFNKKLFPQLSTYCFTYWLDLYSLFLSFMIIGPVKPLNFQWFYRSNSNFFSDKCYLDCTLKISPPGSNKSPLNSFEPSFAFPQVSIWNATQGWNGLGYISRSSHWRCSLRKGVVRSVAKFTGKYLCQSLFFNKVVGLSLQINLPICLKNYRQCFRKPSNILFVLSFVHCTRIT